MNEIYFYHIVPDEMIGKVLIPLNNMKNTDISLYESKVSKYKDREFVLDRKIDILNCLWNDVIHMTAIDPRKLKALKRECGLIKASEYMQKYFKIPLSKLNLENLCVFFIHEKAFDLVDEITDENKNSIRELVEPHNTFEMFDAGRINFYEEANILSKKYFQFVSKSSNKIYMQYAFVPHILYKGNIDTEGLEIVEL